MMRKRVGFVVVAVWWLGLASVWAQGESSGNLLKTLYIQVKPTQVVLPNGVQDDSLLGDKDLEFRMMFHRNDLLGQAHFPSIYFQLTPKEVPEDPSSVVYSENDFSKVIPMKKTWAEFASLINSYGKGNRWISIFEDDLLETKFCTLDSKSVDAVLTQIQRNIPADPAEKNSFVFTIGNCPFPDAASVSSFTFEATLFWK
ncbi:MAG: hypothetical protein R3A11_08425 [Bdellovibrionota bacterium]